MNIFNATAYKKIEDKLSAFVDAEKKTINRINADDNLLGYEKMTLIEKLKIENDR
jgi:hypothetical protein